MPSGGYNKKDQKLISKGYTTVNEMAKEFGRNRASIVTVLKYLGIESAEIIGKHLFYTQFDKEQVAGGFSKLMKHISDYIEYKSITSYVYKSWFNGKGYIESGFKIVKENNPSYSYVVNGRRVHKSHFRKNKIKKMFERGELKFYDSNKTEHENMIENKIYRIYDCGTMKVIYE